MQMSHDQKLVFVAGAKGKYASVGCMKFNSNMRKITFMKMAFGDYKEVTHLHRLQGRDVFMLGLYDAIVILEYANDVLTILEKFENLEMGG